MDKRGLNSIVSSALLILLVVAALGIVWALIRPSLEQQTDEVSGTIGCIGLDLEAVSCLWYSDQVFEVKVRRGADGVRNLEGVKILRVLTPDNPSTYRQVLEEPLAVVGNDPPGPLQTTTYNITGPATGWFVTAVGVIEGGQVCQVSHETAILERCRIALQA